MTRNYGLHKCLQFGLAGLIGWLSISLLTAKAQAQQSNIVPDNTLGTEASQVISNFGGQAREVITGGAIRQINLFHSFGEFNISAGREAYFFSPNADIQNILTRVTGNNPSEILGRLGTFGNSQPNLYLINPNGIVFGENASLDVQGSFIGTTANGIQFANQGNFSATNPQAVPLLTVNPSALLFNQINQGEIINRSRQIFTLGSFYLIGGNITFDGGIAGSLGNRLELGAVAGTGNVELINSGNQMQLAFPDGLPKANIFLQNNAFALTSGGGAITVNADDISLSGNSFISSLLQPGEGQPGIAAGDVVVNATGHITLDNLSSIASQGSENSLGDTGNIVINAQSIRLTNQSIINSNGPRSRGNIILNLKDDVSLDNGSFINTSGIFNPIGKSGDITITTGNINLTNQSAINSGNIGQGQGGKITLKAQESISLNSGSNISSASTASGFGQVNDLPSGDIEIKTRTLKLDGSNTLISSLNLDEGRGGNIHIFADDSILLNGLALILSSSNGQGDAGNIQLETRSLTLTNGGNIGTQSAGLGNSGNLLVNASDSVTLSGIATFIDPQTGDRSIIGSILSTSAFGTGKSGELTINTQRLSINDGGDITTISRSRGGDLTINAKDSVEVVGNSPNKLSAISTSTIGSGDAGSMRINTGHLSIRDGGRVLTSTFGKGNGGNLTVNADRSVKLIGSSADDRFFSALAAAAETGSTGNAGDLTITTPDLLVRDGAQVSTATFGAGKGGNLFVNASNKVELIGISKNSQTISALGTSAQTGSSGNAGNLTIETQDLFVRDGAQVSTATFGAGNGGNLTVNASGSVEIIGASANVLFNSRLSTQGLTGNAGDLTINAQNLLVRDGGQVDAATFDRGKGGNLTVNVTGKVELIGTSPDGSVPTVLSTSALAGSTGDAGDLTINVQDLFVQDGAQISAATSGRGKAGNLAVNASGKVELIGTSADGSFSSGLGASTNQGSTGDAGKLTITTQDLIVRNGAAVSTATFGAGKGGNLTVNAANSVELTGTSIDGRFLSGLSASAYAGSTGDAGNLQVDTQNLLIGDGAQIFTGTFGAGKAGNLTVNASGQIELIGRSADGRFPSGLLASAEPNSRGNAGDMRINTPQLLVNNGAEVLVNARGIGNAGIMTINADTIRLDNQAALNANTRSPNKDPKREQATINLNTQNLTLRQGSSITTNATGENVIGGNINIDTKFLVAVENSRISANSDNSRGGRVIVNAEGVFVGSQPSDVSQFITATSGVGLSGTVDVNSPDNSSIQNSLTELSPNLIDTNALIASSCIARSNQRQENSFIITGSGALPANRPGVLISNYTTGEVRSIATTARPWKKGDPIIEAQGFYRLNNGKLLLSRECS
ncbi:MULTISPECIES: beta strand repeat-containing protein [Calothrix]|uniref:Filamentous hemagglutinin N-terminal domain-containing protein n=2 Tax=Calothrix TaxID=1186 RepID=A0ABR8AK35_9CYAN|nr:MULTISPECIES: filamentous hemagglutinin N-terminal domain-containing protein [Calothrix]MBD2199643.1 filamentous hemagglutinin N-terminal domain-containing protein [Calothrix parietina FACHB-288]MBD2228450.1 filamentous hemagglutinin N-terminal domain-containing protein [Calothrix anomala FACHB-343]